MPRAAKKAAPEKAAPREKNGRPVVYHVAMSLDGYIAGPKGDYDWIVMDPDMDFKAIFERFDTFLMGRKTYALVQQGGPTHPGTRTVVFSRTLRQSEHPKITIVSDNIGSFVRELKSQPGKDIWLFGGGELFRSLLAEGAVDEVSVAVVPVVLGGGVPFLAPPASQNALRLKNHRLYPKSGIMMLEYDVV
jgi:dihydrofolate reductase